MSGRELRKLAGLGAREPVLIIGGAPCQPFSKANYWTESGADAAYRRARLRGQAAERPDPLSAPRSDNRVGLIWAFLERVVEARARGFLFENVMSIVHPRNRQLFERFLGAVRAAGYEPLVVRANALDYGVPQKRERIFVLAARHRVPHEPAATHARSEENRSKLLHGPAAVGPALAPFADDCYFEPEEVVRGRWAAQLEEIPPGWNYKALTAWADHPKPEFVAETRFWHFLLKLHPDRPSWTLPATPGPWVGPFHWDSRRLRTVEMAAIQTFPAGYVFSGTRRERVRQIGNAVPRLMAQAMVASLLQAVQTAPRRARPRADSGLTCAA